MMCSATLPKGEITEGVFAAMLVILRKIGTLGSDAHRISRQIRGKLNSEMGKLIAELIQRVNLGNVERLDGGYLLNQVMV